VGMQRAELRQLYFMHIPKTAGSTMRSIIAQNYNSDNVLHIEQEELPGLSRRDASKNMESSLIHGHFFYGTHEYFPGKPTYFTFLRDPVDRFLSEYFFQQDYKGNIYKLLQQEKLDLEGLIDYWVPYYDNIMTRFLSGATSEQCWEPVTEKHLEIATVVLKNKIDCFGLAEYFDESLLIMAKRYNWLPPLYIRKNVSRRKNVTEVIKEKIRKKQFFDSILYERAYGIFKSRMEGEGELFRYALKEIQTKLLELHNNYDRKKHLMYRIKNGPDHKVIEAMHDAHAMRKYIESSR